MNNRSDISDWNQVEHLKAQLGKEPYWLGNPLGKRAKQSWDQFRVKNNKFFQTMAAIKKWENSIWKINDEHGNRFHEQEGISLVIIKEFQKRFTAIHHRLFLFLRTLQKKTMISWQRKLQEKNFLCCQAN